MSWTTSAARRGDHVSAGLQSAVILPLRSLFVAVILRSIFISKFGDVLPSLPAIARAARRAAALAGGVDLDTSAVEHALVHRAHGAVRLFHRAEFDEAETAR